MAEFPPKLKIMTVWLVLGSAVFLAVQAWQAQGRAAQFSAQGERIELPRAPDGHFYWKGQVNGESVEFLVDTGATGSALPERLARKLGLAAVGEQDSSTAGGKVTSRVVRVDIDLEGGVHAGNLVVLAMPNLDVPLLGMDVLGRLQWQQSDGRLRIDLRSVRR
jgi:aspartyl protease family protein